ncbi:ABC transporter substrate-binding protein [Acidiphilium sp. AL]|uniref:ABC transporter substrate-binding protein n=1 Tax=Acidiphilium iwatense TaxID=768198 RepID=A0ABS9DRZ6_9PROT|nr:MULTISPECIES: ABC transporter substrate-binding protein [Acidiphilium]MCF3945518.1 ABC transporter substrate-binding protein [Acidiphilium iwatense]MCU4159033.1 ABC transporter substrate-binding protein [Acidiphilium sp. AL]
MAAYFRRVLLGAFALLPALAVTPAARAAAPSAPSAQHFIKQSGDKLVSIINGPGSTGQKAADLRNLVNNIVAVDQIGKFVLGRYWRVATPSQRSEYMNLYHQLLAYNITTQIRAYKGVTFTVGRTQTGPQGEMVSTVVTRQGQSPAHVQWVVDEVGGAPKIVDVVVEGTSLRVTERSDYASVINDHGGQVTALLEAMKQQLHKMQAG